MVPGVIVGVCEGTKKRKARESRIEWICKMDRRHTTALDRADRVELLAVAAEYKRRGLLHTAAQVEVEAGA